MNKRHWIKIARATLASTARGWQGLFVGKRANQPEKALKLYEFEGCPYCRLVREVLTELGLDVEVYPCPKGGRRFRQEAMAIGGKAQFPFLIDPNQNVQLYESEDIIKYLYANYADSNTPLKHRLGPLQWLSSMGNTLIGGLDGIHARPSRTPENLLVLYSFEASPFCRPVRETLCELQLPYKLINLGKEQWADMGAMGVHASLGEYLPVAGGKRAAFMDKTNKVMLPYLEDPNTGKAMFESQVIIDYLEQTYGDSVPA